VVAAFKAGLVAYIFMHLSAEKKLIYRILVFTVIFVLGLFWLTYLAWYDRSPLNVTQGFPHRLHCHLESARLRLRRVVSLDPQL
jgi:hypothetical protein